MPACVSYLVATYFIIQIILYCDNTVHWLLWLKPCRKAESWSGILGFELRAPVQGSAVCCPWGLGRSCLTGQEFWLFEHYCKTSRPVIFLPCFSVTPLYGAARCSGFIKPFHLDHESSVSVSTHWTQLKFIRNTVARRLKDTHENNGDKQTNKTIKKSKNNERTYQNKK